MTEQKYRETWLRLLSKYERRGLAVFRQSLRDTVNRIPFDNIETWNYKVLVEMNVNNIEVQKAFFNLYYIIGLAHGKRVIKDLPRTKDLSLFESKYFDFIRQWLAMNAGVMITSVTGELKDYIVKYIFDDINRGKDIRTIARELQKHINSRSFYRWQIMRIVRTETTTAANLGAIQGGNSTGLIWEKQWLSAQDARTRRPPKSHYDHYEMNGVKVPKGEMFNVNGDVIEYPGDPKAQAGNRINCYLPDNFIESNIIEGQKSFYSGKAIEIITRRGERITVTPNHGILTDKGFISANQIDIGQNLICNRFQKNYIIRLVNNYIKKKLFRVENVFRSLSVLWGSKFVMVTTLDFDKDGASMEGNVNIVNSKIKLGKRLNGWGNFLNYFNNFTLKTTSLKSIKICGLGSFKFFGGRNNSTPRRIVSLLHLSFPLLFRHFRPLHTFALGLASGLDVIRFKHPKNNASTDAEFLRELVSANSANISFDNVVSVREFDFSGHVYDFSSLNGVNIVNNIYTSNCRCTVVVVAKRDSEGNLIFT